MKSDILIIRDALLSLSKVFFTSLSMNNLASKDTKED